MAGKSATVAERLLAEGLREPDAGVRRQRIEHEEPDEPRWVPGHRDRDRGFVAGNTGNQRAP